MTFTRLTGAELRAQALAKINEAKTIAKTAQGRNFTPAEQARVNTALDEVKALKAQADDVSADEDLLAQVNALGGGHYGPRTAGRTSDGPWAKAMREHLGRIGAKDLTPSGSLQVPSLATSIAVGGDRPRSVLQLMPLVNEPGELFSYLREVARTTRRPWSVGTSSRPRRTHWRASTNGSAPWPTSPSRSTAPRSRTWRSSRATSRMPSGPESHSR